jgi:hypothetical protein
MEFELVTRLRGGPTVSSIFRTLPGSPFLSECQTLSAIRPGSPQWYQNGVLSASVAMYQGRNLNPALITSDDPGQEGFIVGDELTKFSADVEAMLLLVSCQDPAHNFAATRCMPNSFVRTHWHVP